MLVETFSFNIEDVVRILLPKEFGLALRNDLPDYGGQGFQFTPPSQAS